MWTFSDRTLPWEKEWWEQEIEKRWWEQEIENSPKTSMPLNISEPPPLSLQEFPFPDITRSSWDFGLADTLLACLCVKDSFSVPTKNG